MCEAYADLRAAVRAIDSARGPAGSGDAETVARRIDEAERLVREARASLAGHENGAEAAARRMVEAANYLDYIVEQFRRDGTVESSLTQFASRELTQAAAGAGGPPLNC